MLEHTTPRAISIVLFAEYRILFFRNITSPDLNDANEPIVTVFSTKLKNGVIDVWWLYDDGGLY